MERTVIVYGTFRDGPRVPIFSTEAPFDHVAWIARRRAALRRAGFVALECEEVEG